MSNHRRRIRAFPVALGTLLLVLGSALAWESKPKPFREYPGREYENFPLPPDYQEKSEWVFARLMYPQVAGGRGYGRRGGFRGMNWKQGGSSWTTDYPRSDRHVSEALRRLTHRRQGDPGKQQPDHGSGAEQHPADIDQVARSRQTQGPDRKPDGDRGDDQGQRVDHRAPTPSGVWIRRRGDLAGLI